MIRGWRAVDLNRANSDERLRPSSLAGYGVAQHKRYLEGALARDRSCSDPPAQFDGRDLIDAEIAGGDLFLADGKAAEAHQDADSGASRPPVPE